jgi:hypothetical protein
LLEPSLEAEEAVEAEEAAAEEEEEEDPPLVVAAEEAEEAEVVEEDLPQLLALLCMAMEDPMGASKATLPLSSMVTDPKVNNS